MKTSFSIPVLFHFILSIAFFASVSCKKSEEPSPINPSTALAATNDATTVGQRWATLNGTVNANNISTTVTFEYDTTTSFTNTITADPATVTGNTSTSVSAVVTGLIPNQKYYFRIKAVNSSKTAYGNDKSFKTSDTTRGPITFNPELTYDSVADIDGNIYKTILVGSQVWMAENLNTTKFNDGSDIPFVIGKSAWAGLSTPGYCYYNHDSVDYGALYNWPAVQTGKLCPSGWHVASDEEWTTLATYLESVNRDAGALKEAGSLHWSSPNFGATNETGFTSLPGGYRNSYGVFGSIKRYGYWWSSTESSSNEAFYRAMNFNYSDMDRSSSNKKGGFSVRCIRN